MKSRIQDKVLKQLADDVKSARTRVGLSQEALAFAAGVDRSYVSQLERGIANPSIAILIRLARVLGKTLTIRFTDS
jgi:transcriptional regulator with XRE-family HTH domain